MQDLPTLLRQLESAPFSLRERLAAAAAQGLSAADLDRLIAHLAHPLANVRLGVIEILWRAGHRPSMGALLIHAEQRSGDDRVFAIRALAQLARPDDTHVAALARTWLASGDTFVVAQAKALARALGLSLAESPPSDTPSSLPFSAPFFVSSSASRLRPPAHFAPPVQDVLTTLVAMLLAAPTDAERIRLVAVIDRRGAVERETAARAVFARGNADAVALVTRALLRHAGEVQPDASLLKVLEQARYRLAGSPVACAALDDALLMFAGSRVSASLLSRLAELGPTQLQRVVERLVELPATELAGQAPSLIAALQKRAGLWTAVGPLLVDAAPHLRPGAHADVRALCETKLQDVRRGQEPSAVALLTLTWLLAHVSEPGEALPRHLTIAHERLTTPEAPPALAALCVRLATEESALVLGALLRDSASAVHEAAVVALQRFESPWVRTSLHGVGSEQRLALDLRYQDAQGAPLVAVDRRLLAAGGEEYALDERGHPVRVAETVHGGCLCCVRSRALINRKHEGLRCPSTWEAYLRECDSPS